MPARFNERKCQQLLWYLYTGSGNRSISENKRIILLAVLFAAGYFETDFESMFAQVHTPSILPPAHLDNYLSIGWFRMGQNIFTTNFLNFKGQFYSAVWLRINLKTYQADSTEIKLRKFNARFSVQFSKANINEENEALFLRYRQSVAFEASASLHQLLYGKASCDIYDTYQVEIRDDDKLIACGFFDLGMNAAAGITSFYDPDYRKHSLGKYLIYLKINFCKDAGLDYFYPGYFVPGYSFFDYKLSIGRRVLQFLDYATNQWAPIGDFNPMLAPIRILEDKLNSLQIMMAKARIACELYRYEFFEANLLPELKDVGLFDHPYFLHFPLVHGGPWVTVVVFDIKDETYRLIRCRSVWNSTLPNQNGMYSSELLKEEVLVFSHPSPAEMVSALAVEIA